MIIFKCERCGKGYKVVGGPWCFYAYQYQDQKESKGTNGEFCEECLIKLNKRYEKLKEDFKND